jgi:hypothetical protein
VKPPSAAERLLQHLGVEAPEEIDLPAVAFHLGVLAIRRRELDGCEARIVGRGDNAIISVSSSVWPTRARFSVCHELGHWCCHRGRTLFCSAADIGAEDGERRTGRPEEREANVFAANLLLPPYLLTPLLRPLHALDWRVIGLLAQRFRASRSATALQAVRLGGTPTVLVKHDRSGKRWHLHAPGVPASWQPHRDLDPASAAFDMVFGSRADQPVPRRVGARLWFSRRDAERWTVSEHALAVADGEILVILTLSDEMTAIA